MIYPEVPVSARKQIFQTIGWGIFLICLTKTFMQKSANYLQPLDLVWVLLAVLYIFRGVKVAKAIGSMKLINLTDYPTKVMFVVYSILFFVVVAFIVIYNNYYQDMVISSPYDYQY